MSHRVLAVAAAGALVLATPSVAFSATAQAPAVPATCTQSPSLTHPGGDFGSCLAVGTTLSRAPAVGETAVLTVRVKAVRDEPATRVTIDLPPSLEFTDGTATTAAVSGAGRVQRTAPVTLSLTAGQTVTFTRTVRAVKAGFGEIAATAVDHIDAGGSDSGTDSVFVTSGATSATSHFGAAATTASRAIATIQAPAGAPDARPTGRPLLSAPAPRQPATARPAGRATAGTSCVTGTWNFIDQVGALHGVHNVTVAVRRSSDNVTLASAYSGGDGSYDVCWATGGTTSSVYVIFISSNTVWSVVDGNGNAYNYSTGIISVPDGTTHDFGGLQPGDSGAMRGLHAYQEADDEWQWMYQFVSYQGGCWSPYETTCRSLTIHWTSDSTTGTFWNSSGAYLLAGSPDTLDEPVHEYGHALMYELYGQTFPATTNCSNHDLFVASSTTCGFTEGWADWVATSVYNNMVWTYNGGGTRNLDVTWNEGLGYPDGDQVEGRIAQALRSLTDGVKAPFDNDPGEGGGIKDSSRFFAVLHTYHPATFADFWNDRAAAGQDVSQTALSALYQGTIDYGFRNPLTAGVAKHLPEPVPAHNYSFPTTAGFWSVVAERPDAGSDDDLALYGDSGQTTSVGSSSFGGSTTDFVAVNSNSGHQALQTYYPRVNLFAGSGGYTVEAVQGASTLSSGAETVTFAAGQIVSVRDSLQTSGTPVFYRAVPTSGSLDVQLVYLAADQNVLSRGSALSSVDPGVGAASLLTTTPTATGYAGLVLLDNTASAGTATIYADRTAPTGTLRIDGGAASTTDPNLTLTTTASDADTGVLGMQISTDGTFDSEPVLPYAASATVALHGASGERTVSIRYENNAGQFSDPVSAHINVKAKPVITSVSPATGSTAGGGNVVLTGDFLNGTTGVSFGTAAAASFTVSDPTRVVAVPAAAGAGKVNVRATTALGTSATSAGNAYTFVAQPVVTSVSPAAGPLGGGSTVTVTGTGFSGATSVRFGGTPATSYTVVSKTVIHAVVPAHAAGATDVRVGVPDGGLSAVAVADRYTYQAKPTVSSVNPVSGPAAGGARVTITGTDLSRATRVTFGGTAGTAITVVSSTTLTVTSPAGTPGTVDVVVTTPGGKSAPVAGDGYTYIAAPAVSGIAPKVGPAAGGTTVTITGTGLSGATTVTFGSTVATGLVVVSDTKVRVTSPAGSGVQMVHVTTAGGTSADANAARFTYQ